MQEHKEILVACSGKGREDRLGDWDDPFAGPHGSDQKGDRLTG